MNLRTRRVLAVAFSILVVTATLTPATAALEPSDADGTDGPLINLSYLPSLDSENSGPGNGNGNGGGEPPNQTTTATETPTTTASPGNTALETTVTLPTGTVATETNPRTGKTVTRGHGWKYIAETTGVTQAEIGQVLRNEPTVYEHGNGDYTVIGRTDYLEEVVITIVGGTITMASTEEPAEGPCEKQIHFEPDEEHAIRDGKPLDKLDEVRDAIESAKQVWRSGNPNTPTWLYYITKIEGKGWTIIKVGPKGLHPLAEWVFSTILASDKPDGFFNSKDEALDNLKDRHDNPERIDDNPSEC